MRKIPTLFQRDPDDRRHVIPGEVTPGCEWVLAGEGVATRKWDGTCCLLDDAGAWWARREVKPGKNPPPGWREVDRDETTGKRVGWEPIEQSGFARWHAEALEQSALWKPWTYELIGPRINGNPDCASFHLLVAHGFHFLSGGGADPLAGPADAIAVAVARRLGWEGIVWWRDPGDPDCDKAKLKVRDFPEVNPSGHEMVSGQRVTRPVEEPS